MDIGVRRPSRVKLRETIGVSRFCLAAFRALFAHHLSSLLTPATRWVVMQLSNGLVGGEKDKFYEELEVRDH